MFKKIIITLSMMLYSTILMAETEGWYINASIGIGNKDNPSAVEQEIASMEGIYGEDRVTVALDVGLYWPVYDDSIVIGLVSNATIDSVQSGVGNEVIAHDLEYLGLSAMKFLQGPVGHGAFVRVDYGSADAKYRYSNNSSVVNDGSGTAALIGLGYSKLLSGNRTRMIFSLNAISSTIDDRDFNTTQFMVGFMW